MINLKNRKFCINRPSDYFSKLDLMNNHCFPYNVLILQYVKSKIFVLCKDIGEIYRFEAPKFFKVED